MTNVIAFRAAARERRSGQNRSAEAEILFFTGVRYVRDEAETQVVGAEETALMRLGLKPAAIVPKSSERLQA